jgi:hypothetical protein
MNGNWSASSRCNEFRKPSLDRCPLNWWYDPLQALFISTLATLGWTIGSQVRLAGSVQIGYWTVVFHWCCFGGLIVGQFLGYSIYQSRIMNA